RGAWVDLWRSMRYRKRDGALIVDGAAMRRGARNVTLPAPLLQLPLLARAGALLTTLPPDVDTLAPYGRGAGLVHLSDRHNRLDLSAFPRGRSSAGFLQHGSLNSVAGPGRWVLRINDPVRRRWSLQAGLGSLAHPWAPCGVTIDGQPLPPRAWSYTPADKVLQTPVAARGPPPPR